MHTCAHVYARSHARTYTHARTHMHARTHAPTHARMYARIKTQPVRQPDRQTHRYRDVRAVRRSDSQSGRHATLTGMSTSSRPILEVVTNHAGRAIILHHRTRYLRPRHYGRVPCGLRYANWCAGRYAYREARVKSGA